MKEIDDIIINKVESIRKCVSAAKNNYFADKNDFLENFVRQDAAILNIQRACEQVIDLANHIVRVLKLGAPNHARDSFRMLHDKNIITKEMMDEMGKMIGFRNIAVHAYQEIDIKIVVLIIETKLDNLLKLADLILSRHDDFILQ